MDPELPGRASVPGLRSRNTAVCSTNLKGLRFGQKNQSRRCIERWLGNYKTFSSIKYYKHGNDLEFFHFKSQGTAEHLLERSFCLRPFHCHSRVACRLGGSETNLFLTVLQVKVKIKELADLGSGEDPFPASQMAAFSLFPQGRRDRELSGVSLIRPLISPRRLYPMT